MTAPDRPQTGHVTLPSPSSVLPWKLSTRAASAHLAATSRRLSRSQILGQQTRRRVRARQQPQSPGFPELGRLPPLCPATSPSTAAQACTDALQ